MASITTLPLPTVSSVVNEFAVARGVDSCLPILVAAARQIFPEARIDIHIEDDPEIPDNRQIVFEVEDCGQDSRDRVSAHSRWTDELLRSCPATHVHVFCLLQG